MRQGRERERESLLTVIHSLSSRSTTPTTTALSQSLFYLFFLCWLTYVRCDDDVISAASVMLMIIIDRYWCSCGDVVRVKILCYSILYVALYSTIIAINNTTLQVERFVRWTGLKSLLLLPSPSLSHTSFLLFARAQQLRMCVCVESNSLYLGVWRPVCDRSITCAT